MQHMLACKSDIVLSNKDVVMCERHKSEHITIIASYSGTPVTLYLWNFIPKTSGSTRYLPCGTLPLTTLFTRSRCRPYTTPTRLDGGWLARASRRTRGVGGKAARGKLGAHPGGGLGHLSPKYGPPISRNGTCIIAIYSGPPYAP